MSSAGGGGPRSVGGARPVRGRSPRIGGAESPEFRTPRLTLGCGRICQVIVVEMVERRRFEAHEVRGSDVREVMSEIFLPFSRLLSFFPPLCRAASPSDSNFDLGEKYTCNR